jgi:hypothetical protein
METLVFRQLIEVGAIRSVAAKGVPGGFALVAYTDAGEHILSAQRGHSRVFKHLDTVASFLREIGLNRFTVDLDNWASTGLL